MIPFLKENDYYSAVNTALEILFKLASGEISYKEVSKKFGRYGNDNIIFDICRNLCSGNGPLRRYEKPWRRKRT